MVIMRRLSEARRSRATLLLLVAAGAGAVAGCEQEGVSEQWVDKGVETVPDEASLSQSEQSEGMDAAGPEDAAAADDIDSWRIPDDWIRSEQDRPMRLATFLAPASAEDNGSNDRVEVAITRFAGRVGGELANVNRWRGQVGLAPLDEEELDASLRRWSGPDGKVYAARIKASGRVLLAAGAHDPVADRTTFVRAETTAADADRLGEQIEDLVRSMVGLAEGAR